MKQHALVAPLIEHFQRQFELRIDHPHEEVAVLLHQIDAQILDVLVGQLLIANCHLSKQTTFQ